MRRRRMLGVALLTPSLASAAFTRPFLRQIRRGKWGGWGFQYCAGLRSGTRGARLDVLGKAGWCDG